MKQELRQRLQQERALVTASSAPQDIIPLFQKNIPVNPDDVIAGYFPVNHELDVRPLLNILSATHKIALPVTQEKNMFFRQWTPNTKMAQGNFNIPVPEKTSPEITPDILLVPVLGFDRTGNRLGYGGGFYDRTLLYLRSIKKIIAVGVAYALQEAEITPEPHDQKLDYIITEKQAIKI